MEVSCDQAAGTSWQRGRLDARRGPGRLLFGRMHEDVTIELDAFRAGGRVFCIASAGCTALALAREHEVVAVDINPLQLAYIERRLAGGSIERGSAERLLALLQSLAPLAGWSRSRLREFLQLDQPDEQRAYWIQHLNTKRFRTGLSFLLSRPLLRSIYSASLLSCLPPHFATVLRRRIERCLFTHPNRTNPYAQALFLGTTFDETTPVRADAVQLVCADAADFLERQPRESIAGFALSNILDGMNAAYRRRLVAAVKQAAAPGAMVVQRSFSEPTVVAPSNRAAEDRAMIWGIVDVRPAGDL